MARTAPDMNTAPNVAPVLPKRRLPNVAPAQLSLADEVATYEVNALPDEALRYLAAVDTFRLEGSAPTWRPESSDDA